MNRCFAGVSWKSILRKLIYSSIINEMELLDVGEITELFRYQYFSSPLLSLMEIGVLFQLSTDAGSNGLEFDGEGMMGVFRL